MIARVHAGLLAAAMAALAGAIACAPDPEPPPEACMAIAAGWERASCLDPWFAELTRERSARYAVCRASQLQADGTLDDCHPVAHRIGEVNLELHRGDAGRALATCGTGCIEGCLHGVMEVHVGTLPRDVATLAEHVRPLCDGVPSGDRYACIHGIGHGLRHHGFVELLDAVAVCESSDDASWEDICMGGVLMEQVDIFLPVQLDGIGDVLASICGELEGTPWLEHCAEAIGEGLMFRTEHDLPRSHELCLRLGDTALIDACRHGAEVEAAVNAHVDDHC